MKCYGQWYGGSSYSVPESKDLETFASLKEAETVFRSRLENNDGYTPCVNSESSMWLFFEKPTDDSYPDQIIEVGPRGGVKRVSA